MLDGENTENDQALVAAINAGDDRAFERLYLRYRDWVYRMAYRFTGNHQDAQDVVQETFSYVVKKFPGFVLSSSIKTFLYPAVRNYSIAARKKRQRTVQDEVSLELAAAEEATDVDHDELSGVLKSLPEAQQQVLLMRFVDGMTIPEIAAALELAPGTAKSRLHYAVKALRASPKISQYFGRDDP